MYFLFSGIIYLMFFLSGAAALIYEVVWVRSLSLVFGGTHLAVTAVLSVFMGGLALGSYLLGRYVDRVDKPLRLYGFLEIGIAVSALAFIVMMKFYPVAYTCLAQGKDDHRLYLSLIRILLAVIALIIPTTLMGGTLPVLTRFVSRHSSAIGAPLSLLYGFNTLGAVAGAAAAGFFLLRFYSVSAALFTAISINFAIGFCGLLLPGRSLSGSKDTFADTGRPARDRDGRRPAPSLEGDLSRYLPSVKLVLFGIGVSGFCALGYEVLWTRILTMTIGTSVYGFTVMLMAFLTGIALGSEAYGLIFRTLPSQAGTGQGRIVGFFGFVQLIIGGSALLVTIYIRDLPVHAFYLRNFFASTGLNAFDARQWANIALAFSYLLIPSFFMGLAFPLAGEVAAFAQKKIGHTVGRVLTYNTIGAILGSAISGFLLIYLFGIERSLQFLSVINIGLGFLVMLSILHNKIVNATIVTLSLALILFLALDQDAFRVWDAKYFAIFRNNQPDAFDTPAKIKDAKENTDVLYYHEGVNETISVIKIKGGNQAVLVNGKVVASADLGDQQCQLTLGHLPMLLHKDPKKVLVVGLGTGMTVGAVSVHPELEELTLAEIEPSVPGAARTFGKYNNHVLDNPKLRIVFNDGRNFLMTTDKKFDVITADPIHPWTQGSGYLYTEEYFKTASEHLSPGGIMCQWLPIYELKVKDLRSVARTFSINFKYTMAWLTAHDAEIIGSNAPIIIDEQELQRRISSPAVHDDLKRVAMGSATDFLSYFIMGTDAMTAFGKGGVINTDDNLYLEFSTPVAVGINTMGRNVWAIAQYRESILPYLAPAPQGKGRDEQISKWRAYGRAAAIADRARSLYLGRHDNEPEFQILMADLDKHYPEFAPGRFLKEEHLDELSHIPKLFRRIPFTFLGTQGEKHIVAISVVTERISDERIAVMFVDNAARKIFGQRYLSGTGLDEKVPRFANLVMSEIEAAYREQARQALTEGKAFPSTGPTLLRFKEVVNKWVEGPLTLQDKDN
jgi:spermidine synthase